MSRELEKAKQEVKEARTAIRNLLTSSVKRGVRFTKTKVNNTGIGARYFVGLLLRSPKKLLDKMHKLGTKLMR